jgi:hypothetical protein
MNILEAYKNKYKQIIILIIGVPCSNKSEIAKELSVDLELDIIKINDYLKPDAYIEKTVSDINFKLYEHPDNYDFEKLCKDVNEKKTDGLILYGNYIDIEKIDFTIDFCYFFNMNTTLCKTVLIEKKLLPYETDDEKVKIYFKEIFEPIYDKLKKEITINKFFNIKNDTVFEKIYDEVFDNLMDLIKNKLYNMKRNSNYKKTK